MRGRKMDGLPTREQVLRDFFAAWTPEESVEHVPLQDAAWRITAEPLFSVNTIPVVRASGSDGIAVRSADFASGMPDYTTWREGEDFVRADTGDDFDDRFDAVIAIEEVDLVGDGRIAFISPDVCVSSGSGVRKAGSTVRSGEKLIDADMPLRPVDLAALAMGGIAMVPVRKKPRVAFIPTGSELVPQGFAPRRGENVDANSIMVKNLLIKMGAQPLMFPIVRDEPEPLRQALHRALGSADIVIMNAGTAKGGEDFTFRLLGEGRLIHHYVAAAPGRPLGLAVIDGKPVINLPGPTLGAFFGMDWCVRAAVYRFLHQPMPKRPTVKAVLTADLKTSPHMDNMCRIDIRRTASGYEATPLNFHAQGAPVCLASAGMYISPVGESFIAKGETIEVELLRGEEYIG